MGGIVEKILLALIFIGSFTVSIIALILPWCARKRYLSFINFAAKFILRFNFVMVFVNKYAFSKETEAKLLLEKE